MIYSFEKYQCAGNDFIMIKTLDEIDKDDIWKLCNRRFGIGADGLITINENANGGFNIKYYNSDGSTDTLCGNGSLCSIDFALKNFHVKNNFFNASDGLHQYVPSIKDSSHQVIFHNCNIPQIIHPSTPINLKPTQTKISEAGYFINTGSPHYVIFTDDTDSINILSLGKYLRHNINGNNGCNVDFVEVIKENTLKIRTYERGVEDETLSCGTGSVASAICYSIYKIHSDNYSYPDNTHFDINVYNRGGKHFISYNILNSIYTDIYLQGKPEMVFMGEIEI